MKRSPVTAIRTNRGIIKVDIAEYRTTLENLILSRKNVSAILYCSSLLFSFIRERGDECHKYIDINFLSKTIKNEWYAMNVFQAMAMAI